MEAGLTISATQDLPEEAAARGLTEFKRRVLPDGSVIEFELADLGTLTAAGEPRKVPYRAYFFQGATDCEVCEGTGRVPSTKRPGATIQCKVCRGSGGSVRQRKTSATTILDAVLPKPGLYSWNEKHGIYGVYDAFWEGYLAGDGLDADDWVRIVRQNHLGAEAAKQEAASRGIKLHALLEAYMRTGEPPRRSEHPEEHHGYVRALCRFLLEHDPQPEMVEELVCDPQAGYAGRSDLVARVGDRRIRFDLKTQENAGIYAAGHVQVRLYERAAVACGDEPSDELQVAVLAADGEYRVMPCEATDRLVDRTLAFYEDLKPVDALCESLNRSEKEARR